MVKKFYRVRLKPYPIQIRCASNRTVWPNEKNPAPFSAGGLSIVYLTTAGHAREYKKTRQKYNYNR